MLSDALCGLLFVKVEAAHETFTAKRRGIEAAHSPRSEADLKNGEAAHEPFFSERRG